MISNLLGHNGANHKNMDGNLLGIAQIPRYDKLPTMSAVTLQCPHWPSL